MSKKILIIDDDMDLCTLLGRFLTKNGYEVEMAYSGSKGITKFTEGKFDLVICDYRLGDMEGINVLTSLRKENPSVKVLMITGYSDIKTAVEVIKMGAYDYIVKPLIPDEVLNVVNKAIQSTAPVAAAPVDNTASGNKVRAGKTSGADGEFMIGKASATRALYDQINIVAGTNYSIILYGESGTGKEVIAKTIHDRSNRNGKPFVAMDCGTLSKELAGSELFGHVKGAFTGALQDKEGHFELADGGTLFLDEVGNLSLDVQATLLRVIQERKFKRVGGNKEMNVDVRIIVASNENLQDAYRKGKFREDLYHRFNEFSVNLPPLRQRQDDILAFAEFFLDKTSTELGKEVAGIEDSVMQTFLQYSWPGNLREFRNVVRRAVLLTPAGEKISAASLPWEITNANSLAAAAGPEKPAATTSPISIPAPKKELDLKDAASRAEYETIMAVLQQVNFNKKKAAEMLNIDRKTLYNKIKNFQDQE
ncbi:sigma-54 dependent transcriptional regulator [Terrimonas sp. NA20]|uniref:Sigma-54 dependent transcriptional regulator n=1 Tax=Terrimonas ginsenosidimutans TaxID=2908004 RepID=A0ABS9KUT2_9BACT|nr:sigma-54 dependent transcriptional regulator [Terrimonas ginsenosidimutans]MCG2616107.1 sigma-54 dependent transcriptional regulator [Terrimonas ginsenosidimutans]